MYSLRSNGRYQLFVLGSGPLGLIYFIISNGFHFQSVKGLVIALAYAWGLIFAIYLMGHGLVAIPRKLYRNASVSNRLRRVQAQAPRTYERMMRSIEDLDQLELQVAQLNQKRSGATRELQEWIEELAETSTWSEGRRTTASKHTVPPVITVRYLAGLTRDLKRARHKRVRFIDEWDHLVQSAVDLEAILNSSTSKSLTFPKDSRRSLLSVISPWTPYSRFILHTYVFPALRYFFSAFFAMASISIVYSELIKFAFPRASLITLTVLPTENSPNFFNQCIASAWISYMCAAALLSISEVKIWGNRALVRRQTYAESACWYSGQVAKLTVPLAYNFITFLPEDVYHETMFYKFLGSLINLTPLGSGFSTFFPIFILFPVCATLFNLYGRARRMFGFGSFLDLEEEDDPNNSAGYGTGGWREGRALIERETQSRDASGVGLLDQARMSSASASPTQGSRVSSPTRKGRGASSAAAYRDNPRPRDRSPKHQAKNNREDDEEDVNVFENFAHRVKNTWETADLPRWLRPSGGGGGDGGGGGGIEDGGFNFARLFGRDGSNERLRL